MDNMQQGNPFAQGQQPMQMQGGNPFVGQQPMNNFVGQQQMQGSNPFGDQQQMQQSVQAQQGMTSGNPFAGQQQMQGGSPFGGQQQMQGGNPFVGQQDMSANVEPVNPFSQVQNDVPDNSQYIAAYTAAQFTGVVEKKKGKLLHFEYLPFGKQIGTYDPTEVAKYKKLCSWMFFMPFLIFAPLISDDCRKSGYVREVASGLFGLIVKYTVVLAILGALWLPVLLLGLIRALRGIVTVLSVLNSILVTVLGIYYLIIFIRSFLCVRKGIRFGHVFTSSYFEE